MKYVGLDVHVEATVWCCLDGEARSWSEARVATTVADLVELAKRLGPADELVFGQEAGKMSYFVHDTLTETGRRLLTCNANHLRMIAASRKKTDRRDA